MGTAPASTTKFRIVYDLNSKLYHFLCFVCFCFFSIRFAQFFCCPLFTPSATGREVNAVDSENSRNLQSDPWRLFQLDKSLAREDHDFSKFGTGNHEQVYVSFFFFF